MWLILICMEVSRVIKGIFASSILLNVYRNSVAKFLIRSSIHNDPCISDDSDGHGVNPFVVFHPLLCVMASVLQSSILYVLMHASVSLSLYMFTCQVGPRQFISYNAASHVSFIRVPACFVIFSEVYCTVCLFCIFIQF